MRREANTPIVILSGRYDEREKVAALDRGADDYVTKPFGVDELNARLRVALRRAAGPRADDEGGLSVGPLCSTRPPRGQRQRDARRPVPSEFEILRVLLRQPGRDRHQGSVAASVWGEAYRGEDSYVYVHVAAAPQAGRGRHARSAARFDCHRTGRGLPHCRRESLGVLKPGCGPDRPLLSWATGARSRCEHDHQPADHPRAVQSPGARKASCASRGKPSRWLPPGASRRVVIAGIRHGDRHSRSRAAHGAGFRSSAEPTSSTEQGRRRPGDRAHLRLTGLENLQEDLRPTSAFDAGSLWVV